MGNYLYIELTNKKIKLLEEYNDTELNNREDVFIVTGGFGASPDTMGRALFITSEKTGKKYRIDAYDKIELVED